MEQERIFNGTPLQFSSVVRVFASRWHAERNHLPFWIDPRSSSNADLLTVTVRPPEVHTASGRGQISAQSLPGSKTLLIVRASDDAWSGVEPWWQRLLSEMERQGWIPPAGSPSAAPDQLVRPAEPGPNSPVVQWLAWYHGMQRRGFRVSLVMLAEKSGYSVGTFRNTHTGCADPLCQSRRRKQKK